MTFIVLTDVLILAHKLFIWLTQP